MRVELIIILNNMEAFSSLNFCVETKVGGSLGNVLLGLGAYLGKSFMIYQPMKETQSNFEPFGMTGSSFSTRTKDGVNIGGYIFSESGVKETSALPTVVYFHENAGTLGQRFQYFSDYVKRCKCNLICFGYRGYSKSTGHPSFEGIKKDAIAVFEHIWKEFSGRIDLGRIFLHGKSLGGGVSSFIASHPDWKDKFKGIVLDTCFKSLASLVCQIVPALKPVSKPIFENESWDVLENSLNFNPSLPVHVIGVVNDEICEYSHSVGLRDCLKESGRKVTFEAFEVGGHNDYCYISPDRYYGTIDEFISSNK